MADNSPADTPQPDITSDTPGTEALLNDFLTADAASFDAPQDAAARGRRRFFRPGGDR